MPQGALTLGVTWVGRAWIVAGLIGLVAGCAGCPTNPQPDGAFERADGRPANDRWWGVAGTPDAPCYNTRAVGPCG